MAKPPVGSGGLSSCVGAGTGLVEAGSVVVQRVWRPLSAWWGAGPYGGLHEDDLADEDPEHEGTLGVVAVHGNASVGEHAVSEGVKAFDGV